MNYLRADTLDKAIRLKSEHPDYLILFGGTDIAVTLQKREVEGLIDISHLDGLNHIKEYEDFIEIGALCSINTVLESTLIQQHFPLLSKACSLFASHQVRNLASLGGNIVNDSPVADMIAPLLVLECKVVIRGINGHRSIPVEALFVDYKQLDLHNEIISAFHLPKQPHQWYYRKVGARAKLNISKVSLAMVKNSDGFLISGASLNPFVKRFHHLEAYLKHAEYPYPELKEMLQQDIAPSGSFRSSKAYRSHLLYNMLLEALEKLKEQ